MIKKKYAMKFIIFAFQTFLLACASQPQLTREEGLQMRRSYDAVRTRVYHGKCQEEVLTATTKLFSLADRDYFVTPSETGCMAARNWSVYFVIGFVMGKDYWYVTTEKTDAGTKIMIREVTYATGYAGTPTGGGGAQVTALPSLVNPDFIEYDEMRKQPQLYEVFFLRLDYLLGLSDKWVSCDDASVAEYVSIDPLCLVASDKKPE